MLLTTSQVHFIRRAGSFIGLLFLVVYLAGFVVDPIEAPVYRELIFSSGAFVLLIIAIAADFVYASQEGASKK